MTPEEAVTRLRLDLADPRLPDEGSTPDEDSLWSDVELYSYLDDAQNMFARRTRCFPDSTSFSSSFVVDDKFVSLDVRIVDLRVGYMTTAQKELKPIRRSEIGRVYTCDDYGMTTLENWREKQGTPYYAVTDMEPYKVRLVPIPQADDTIEWEVWRLPLTAVEDDLSLFEIDTQWHTTLLLYAKYLAYIKQDAEVVDMARAQENLNLWDAALTDEIIPYYDKLFRGPGTIMYGGIY